MAGAPLLVWLLLVPAAGWIVSLFVLRSALEIRARQLPPGSSGLPRNRIAILVGYGATPIFLGLVLWAVLEPLADGLAGSSFAGSSAFENLLLWTTVAYAVASSATSAARSVFFVQRLRQVVTPRDFARVLILTTIPFTPTVFALIVGFLVMGVVGDFLAGHYVPLGAAISSVLPVQLSALSTLATPVAAHASGRVQDIEGGGFNRIILIMDVPGVLLVLGLVLVFLSLNPLTT